MEKATGTVVLLDERTVVRHGPTRAAPPRDAGTLILFFSPIQRGRCKHRAPPAPGHAAGWRRWPRGRPGDAAPDQAPQPGAVPEQPVRAPLPIRSMARAPAARRASGIEPCSPTRCSWARGPWPTHQRASPTPGGYRDSDRHCHGDVQDAPLQLLGLRRRRQGVRDRVPWQARLFGDVSVQPATRAPPHVHSRPAFAMNRLCGCVSIGLSPKVKPCLLARFPAQTHSCSSLLCVAARTNLAYAEPTHDVICTVAVHCAGERERGYTYERLSCGTPAREPFQTKPKREHPPPTDTKRMLRRPVGRRARHGHAVRAPRAQVRRFPAQLLSQSGSTGLFSGHSVCHPAISLVGAPQRDHGARSPHPTRCGSAVLSPTPSPSAGRVRHMPEACHRTLPGVRKAEGGEGATSFKAPEAIRKKSTHPPDQLSTPSPYSSQLRRDTQAAVRRGRPPPPFTHATPASPTPSSRRMSRGRKGRRRRPTSLAPSLRRCRCPSPPTRP